MDTYLEEICDQVMAEVARAMQTYPPMNSPHEGHSVLLEEMKELEVWVFRKPGARDPEEMRKEAIQLAAMAVRFIIDIVDGGRSRK